MKAAWIWGIEREFAAVSLPALADKGYQGAAHAKTPYRGKNTAESQKEANRSHAKLRAPGEMANAQLKAWKSSASCAAAPGRAGQIAKAILVLQAQELKAG
jgi:DDE superfamily endonuclease